MKKIAFAAAALLLAGTQTPAFAQAKAPAKPAATEEQQTHAVQAFAVMSSAMRSDKVDNDVKSALMGCIYSNKLETISDAIDKLIVANPGKVDRNNPDQLLSAMVAVCGYKPTAASAPASPPTPRPSSGTAQGR
ncbi:MAG: hypothetical protein ACXWI5_01155 [Croceibacterium sp.]